MTGLSLGLKKILQAKNIVVAGHINPDGDSIGSLLGLGLGLRQLGKRVSMISSAGVPVMYKRLPGAGEILRSTGASPDLAVAVDCGSKELLGKALESFRRAKCILEIDHHEIRDPFGDIRIIDSRAASVGEIVYRILKELKVDINRQIAENILTSIIVETNSFRLPNVRPLTFRICARLLKTGVDFSELSEMVYWSKPRRVSVLVGFCLSKCRFLEEGRIAWCLVKRADLKRLQAKEEDTDSVANEMLAIKGVEIALFFKEENKEYLRVSLRSKYGANVASLARDFGGGGHFNAAGGHLKNDRKLVKKLLNDSLGLLRQPKVL